MKDHSLLCSDFLRLQRNNEKKFSFRHLSIHYSLKKIPSFFPNRLFRIQERQDAHTVLNIDSHSSTISFLTVCFELLDILLKAQNISRWSETYIKHIRKFRRCAEHTRLQTAPNHHLQHLPPTYITVLVLSPDCNIRRTLNPSLLTRTILIASQAFAVILTCIFPYLKIPHRLPKGKFNISELQKTHIMSHPRLVFICVFSKAMRECSFFNPTQVKQNFLHFASLNIEPRYGSVLIWVQMILIA